MNASLAAYSAHLALNRFGMGARPGEAAGMSSPREWLLAQLTPQPLPAVLAELPRTAQVLMEFPQFLAQQRLTPAGQPPRPARAMASGAMTSGESSMAAGTAPAPAPALETSFRQRFGPGLTREVQARLSQAAQTDQGFHERLAWFWANHFTVSATRAQVISLAGPFEREAIRPHVSGRFVDMLLAAMRHPAMLIYLDNQQSFGPNSRAGLRRDKGLNENLAREALELHALGVNGGYSQADVTELALALTGWGVRYNPLITDDDRFAFDAARHEPGERRILKKIYGQTGEAQAEAVLRDLAAHPATAQHLATKLARHFTGDRPPPALVDRLALAYRQSEGSLKAMTTALIDAPEAWQPSLAKVKRPDEYLVSAMRALGLAEMPAPALMQSLRAMGQPTFYAPSPQGWPDEQSSWLAPDSVLKRVEWADAAAHRLPVRDVRQLASSVLGPSLSADTLREIERAESPQQALVLLLASPDFQRR